MTRRILGAILVVTLLAIAAFGVPLGIAIRRLYRNQALAQLEREAMAATVEVPTGLTGANDRIELPRHAATITVGVYDPQGRRVAGHGVAAADAEVRDAAQGRLVVKGSSHGQLVVALPVAKNEHVFAVVRVAEPELVVEGRIRRAWMAMAVLGGTIMLLAALLGRRLARLLVQPVSDLADATMRLGAGDFMSRAGRSGISELDRAADDLNVTARRLGELVERERSFSADASHQLRTPLAALRVGLEATLADRHADRDGAIVEALAQADRLEGTIVDLLALARDQAGDRGPLDLATVLADVEASWKPVLARTGRSLVVRFEVDVPTVHASTAAVRQVLEVLVSNAGEHGGGQVDVNAREVIGGLALEVSDEGAGVQGDPQTIFRRREGSKPGRGIGLALARSLTEAEGGKLLLRNGEPRSTFVLLFPSS